MSPFTYAQQAQEYAGQMVLLEVSMPPMAEAIARAWVAWQVALYGQSGTFQWQVPGTNRGAFGGTPLVNGAHSAQSKTLAIDGCTASITGWAKAGDWIQVGNLLLMVLQDANTNGSGQVTLDIAPRLAAAISDNAPVTTSNAKGLFRMASNTAEWDIDEAKIYGISFKAMEAR